MITIRSEGGKTKPYIKEYMVDTIAELEHLPRHVATGSSAICLEDQSQYMLNGASEWVKFEMGGSGGGGGEDILFQEKTVEITKNGTTEITADEGYALSKATVKVAVESTSKLPQVVDKTITELTAEDLEGATKISERAFYECNKLKGVTIPDSVTSIGDNAFYSCDSLTSVTIPDSVKSIGWYTFYNCDSLTSVTIGNGVTGIGVAVFEHCDSLTSVRIGGGITSINSNAFAACFSLTDIYIDKEEDSVYNAPWGATNATVHWNTPLPTEEA